MCVRAWWMVHRDRDVHSAGSQGRTVLARAARKHQWLAGNSIRTANCDILYQAVLDLDVGTAMYRHDMSVHCRSQCYLFDQLL